MTNLSSGRSSFVANIIGIPVDLITEPIRRESLRFSVDMANWSSLFDPRNGKEKTAA